MAANKKDKNLSILVVVLLLILAFFVAIFWYFNEDTTKGNHTIEPITNNSNE